MSHPFARPRMPVTRAATTIVGCLVVLLVPAGAAGAQASRSFTAAKDTSVSGSTPSGAAGSSRSLRVEGSPRRRAFLLFDVRGLGSPVGKATLRVYSRTGSRSGVTVRAVKKARWGKRTLRRPRGPQVSTVLARSGRVRRNRWLSFDVTRGVRGDGTVTLALVTRSRRVIRFASREAGSRFAPRLEILSGQGVGNGGGPGQGQGPSGPAGPGPAGGGGGTQPAPDPRRPYDARSPWNTAVGNNPSIDPMSPLYVNAIADNGLPLTSDPDQYAIPVYAFDAGTPRQTVEFDGYYSTYDAGDDSRVGHGFAPTISGIPVPGGAVQSAGSDGQVIFWDQAAGVEYAFWQFYRDGSGTYHATNGYRYHTGGGYFGRFADGLAGRGAGTPYFAGLVRRWEIDRGRIDHALAFAYDSPAGELRYPASKSDGEGVSGIDPPEGTRLQLNPALTEADFNSWGLAPEAKTIARALQTYGMYIIDNSGSSKLYLEDRLTAGWPSGIDRNLPSKIPWNQFRVVKAPAPS